METHLTPFTANASRAKSALMLLICIGLATGGIYVIHHQDTPALWLAVAFFGLGIPLFIVKMLPGASSIRVNAEGIEMTTLFRKELIRWTDVSGFGTYRVGLNTFVGFDYSAGYEPQAGMRRLAQATAGYEGGLPDTYGFKADELAAILEQWRRACSGK